MQKISESGMIGQDGLLRMPMDRLNQEFARHKGQRVIMRIEFAESGSSAAQLAYYFRYIIPTIQTALWDKGDRRTEKQVDMWLRRQCVSCYNEYGGILEAQQMSQSDMSDFIEWLKQFAAENFHVYIEDPRVI